jgi:hypothetical protein
LEKPADRLVASHARSLRACRRDASE